MPFARKGLLEEAMTAFKETWKDYDQAQDPKRNQLCAGLIFHEVMEVHQLSQFGIDVIPPPKSYGNREDLSADEFLFAVDLGFSRLFAGKIDAVGQGQGPDQGQDQPSIWAIEYKTASMMGSSFSSIWEGNPQVVGYSLALRIALGQCLGTVIEGIHVAKTLSDIVILPIYVSEEEQDTFRRQIGWIDQMISHYAEEENFPRQITGCGSYGMFGVQGWGLCPYRFLCFPKGGDDWRTNEDLFEVSRHDLFQDWTD